MNQLLLHNLHDHLKSMRFQLSFALLLLSARAIFPSCEPRPSPWARAWPPVSPPS